MLNLLLAKTLLLTSLLFLAGCDDQAWNDPYPNQSAAANTLYTAFTAQPKHLDPAISYSADEWVLIGQIYEPVIEYNYLLRPYKLQPLLAAGMPKTTYDPKTKTTTYRITLKPDIMYQPHPALAKNVAGEYIYHNLTRNEARQFTDISDFKQTGTRALTAHDYANQIKRLADPTLNSPIFGFLSPYIVGLPELRQQLIAAYAQNRQAICLDLRNYELPGVKVIDDFTYEIKIHDKYEQFKYWLEMPFFAPVPWEAGKFYCQAGMQEHNLSLDTYPIGTGPYYLQENNPERRMVMLRNPNYHADYYPTVGLPEDKINGLLDRAGKKLPIVDSIIFSLEKESVPYWDKFLQGYYDRSGISADNFNSALSQATHSSIQLSKPLIDKGISLTVANTLSTFYWGFNMLDETVGGNSDRNRKLRQAISLAFDMQEFIAIFMNGRAIPANGPLPPGVDGYSDDKKTDPIANLELAKKILSEAGYPDGRNKQTGKQLQLFYDAISQGDPDERAMFSWISKQFSKLNIDLIIRATDYNRFQDKIRNGTTQMFFFGWNADYPDPENFLFLFYGPNGRTLHDGENASNYNNTEFDRLFVQFKNMQNSPQRMQLIKQMVALLQRDVPWVWGFFPQSYVLSNAWYAPTKPSDVAINNVKYVQIDPNLRAKMRMLWNQPLLWPIVVLIILKIIFLAPAIVGYIRSTTAKARRVQ